MSPRSVVIRRRGPFAALGRMVAAAVALAVRFVSGQPMDGVRRTDATFWRPGTEGVAVAVTAASAWWSPASGKVASRWMLRAGWDRAWRRLAVVVGLYAWHELHQVAALLTWAGTFVALGGFGWWRFWPVWVSRRHYRRVLRPVAVAVRSRLGMSPDLARDPGEWINVPVNYLEDEDSRILVELPEGYTPAPADQRDLIRIIAGRIGGADWDGTLHAVNVERAVLELRRAPQPPSLVKFEDLLPHLNKDPDRIVAGLGPRGVPVSIDLRSDSPHILVSGGSGAGKSVLCMGFEAQFLRDGARIEFVDIVKAGASVRWAKGLPNCRFWRQAESAHNMLVELGDIITDRGEGLWKAGSDSVNANQRIVLVMEETNATIDELNQYWQENKPKGHKGQSPAIIAYRKVLRAGRELGVHAVVVAQYGTVQAVGGPDSRANLAARCLARFDPNQWKSIAGAIPMPSRSRDPEHGRWRLILGGAINDVQVGLWTVDQARSWALNGAADTTREAPQTTTADAVPPLDETAADVASGGGTVPGVGHDPEELPRVATLRRLVLSGQVPGYSDERGYNTLRKALARDRKADAFDAPHPDDHDEYELTEILAWLSNRPRTANEKAS